MKESPMFKRFLEWVFGPPELDPAAEQRRVADETRIYARGLEARLRWDSQVQEAKYRDD